VDRIQKHPRKYYNLPDDKYLFLYIFDFNSSVVRKNPLAAILAFKKAFSKSKKNVGLVLKAMNITSDDVIWLSVLKECESDNRIYLLTQTLSRMDLLGLINSIDAYISLHRSEGFGRSIAEAILLQKSIIATGYSGNVDYMSILKIQCVDSNLIELKSSDYHWQEEDDKAMWADPSIDSAAKLMNDACCTSNLKYLTDIFSPVNIGDVMCKVISKMKWA
jgi:glycosyltransferase involved in cell wall biosynthesis